MFNYFYSSEKGLSHTKNNMPKQDNCVVCDFKINDKNYLISAVADGAGSAKYSDLSSYFICKLFTKKASIFLKNNKLEDLTREIVGEWFIYFQKVINRAIKVLKIQSTREFATTLLFSILSEDYSVFIQIGDGIIATGNKDDLNCIFLPQNGEYLNTTHFATEEDAADIFMFSSTDKKVEFIAMFTDGLEQVAFDFNEQKPHIPFFRPFFAAARNLITGYSEILSEKLGEFLSSEKINQKTDDDKTLFIAVSKDS